MSLKILFVASLHHPKELQAAIDQTPPDQPIPLFPPSVSIHFYERALRKRGYILDVFWRNLPTINLTRQRAERHTQGLTPGKIVTAVMNRVPPHLNPDYRLRNAALLQKAKAFQPDFIWLTGDNRVIYPATLAAIKAQTGCKIVYTCGTSPIVFAHPMDQHSAPYYDLVLANDYYHGIQWLELGAKRMECLPVSACEPDFHHPYTLSDDERRAYTCDVAFVGTLIPANLYQQRVDALEALRDFDLGIWSVHDVPASLRPYVRGSALGETMLRVLSAAKITLNVHGNFMRYGGNMRLFEAAGVGTLQIADNLPGLQQWLSVGEMVVTYRNLDELRDNVAYYLAHDAEREAIARCAREHVYQHHTYDQRTAKLEELFALVRDGESG